MFRFRTKSVYTLFLMVMLPSAVGAENLEGTEKLIFAILLL